MKGYHYDPTAQVVIASVGSLRAALMSQAFNYTNLVCLVIDEADEVLNNTTFAQDIVSVTKMFRGLHLPVQILLFSATFDEKVLRFTRKIAPGAVLIQKATSELKLDTVHLVRTEMRCDIVCNQGSGVRREVQCIGQNVSIDGCVSDLCVRQPARDR